MNKEQKKVIEQRIEWLTNERDRKIAEVTNVKKRVKDLDKEIKECDEAILKLKENWWRKNLNE